MDSIFWLTGLLIWCGIGIFVTFALGIIGYWLYRYIGLVVALSVLARRFPKIVKPGHSPVKTILGAALDRVGEDEITLHSFNRENVYFEYRRPFDWKIVDTNPEKH